MSFSTRKQRSKGKRTVDSRQIRLRKKVTASGENGHRPGVPGAEQYIFHKSISAERPVLTFPFPYLVAYYSELFLDESCCSRRKKQPVGYKVLCRRSV